MTQIEPSKAVNCRPVKVLLIDDQPIIAESVKLMLKDEKDIEFAYCSDPTQAIKVANEFSPTVILQDLVMPEIDGMTLVRYFRVNSKTKEVPLIVLSSKEEPVVKAEAFACGANDYLVKLPDKVEMIARVRYHSQGYIRLLERNEAFDKLAKSRAALQAELGEAAEYVRSLLPPPEEDPITVKWEFLPSQELGGDAFGYHWLDDDNFAVYLLDVCGHGVGAALLSISVINVLRTYALGQTDYLSPKSVLSALNAAFPMEKNNQMFFTMWYAVYNKESRCLTYASGGHPPALLIDSSEKIHQLNTDGFLIGGIDDAVFNEQSCTVGEGSHLLVYSDGVYEIQKKDGSRTTLDDFFQIVSSHQGGKSALLDKIITEARKINGSGPFIDDFSIVHIIF
jgi:phosphoserine phosphatase RsbU/P